MSDPSIEDYKERNQALTETKEHLEQMVLAQAPELDDIETLYDDILEGETVEVELDLNHFLHVMALLERSLGTAGTPIESLIDLDVFLSLEEQQREVLQDHVEDYLQEMEQQEAGSGPGGMFR